MSLSKESETDSVFGDSSLPLKSIHKYKHAYESFMIWKKERYEESLDEEVFLAYFTELAKVQKPSTLSAQYSMLKATVQAKHQVNVKNYAKLLLFLKKYMVGFKCTKSKVLTAEHILKFVNDAPDENYLATKVALIIGVGGSCKIFELTDLTINDIKTHGDLMLVQIQSQVRNDRMFVVKDEFVPVVKKYQALRPKKMPTNRFFLNYRSGLCTRQVIGRNKLASLPKQIASYLGLPNPEQYTGHCFRRSGLASNTTMMTVPMKVINQEAGSSFKNETGPMTTLANKQENVQAEINEFDIKVEEMNGFDEEMFQFPMEFVNDPPTNSQAPVSGRESRSSDIIDFSVDTSEDMEDYFHINGEEINRTIKLSSQQGNKSLSENDTKETNINVAGNNIRIFFKNCAHVGNVTVNINNK